MAFRRMRESNLLGVSGTAAATAINKTVQQT